MTSVTKSLLLFITSHSACLGLDCHTWLLKSRCCCQSSQIWSWLTGRYRRRRVLRSDQSCLCGSWIFPRASQSPCCSAHSSSSFNSRNWHSRSTTKFIGGGPPAVVAARALNAGWPTMVSSCFDGSSHWAARCDCCHDGAGSVVAAFIYIRLVWIYIFISILYINILTKFW